MRFDLVLPWVVAAVLGTLGEPAPASEWNPKASNPAPAEKDFLLPMPCGGEMVFVPVMVPHEHGPDRRVMVSGAGDDSFKEAVHARYLAGSFSNPDLPGGRHYYLGKYEVSRQQWHAVVGECETLANLERDHLPVTDITHTQATGFAEQYSIWLIANARSRLPSAGGVPAFVRLPTEVEWEYAARGAGNVFPHQFVGRTFPLHGKALARYVQYNSSVSAAGQLQPIGLLEPNPAGLHDILGNAAEFSTDRFRATRGGRLFGQAGGMVVRGGSFLTPEESVRSAHREELPFYGPDGQPARRRDLGLRVVLATPVIPEDAASFQSFVIAMAGSDERTRELDDLYAELSFALEDSSQRDQLTTYHTEVERLRRSMLEQRARSLNTLLKTNAWTRSQLRHFREIQQMNRKSYETVQQCAASPDSIETQRVRCEQRLDFAREKFQEARDTWEAVLGFYQAGMLSIVSDFQPAEVVEQQEAIVAEWPQRDALRHALCQFVSHTARLRQIGTFDEPLERQIAAEIDDPGTNPDCLP